MNIVTVGRGNIGNGLATLWTAGGHNVTTLGREGGDASNADVLLVAVPGTAIADALRKVDGLTGKIAIDATNIYAERTGRFASLSEEIQSFTHGPVAKSFNLNYASLLDQVAAQRVRPSSLYAADDDARAATDALITDAGYDPVFVGGIDRRRGHRARCTHASDSASDAGRVRCTRPGPTGPDEQHFRLTHGVADPPSSPLSTSNCACAMDSWRTPLGVAREENSALPGLTQRARRDSNPQPSDP